MNCLYISQIKNNFADINVKSDKVKISDFLKVKNAKSIHSSKKDLNESNKLLSIDNLQDEVSNSPFELV